MLTRQAHGNTSQISTDGECLLASGTSSTQRSESHSEKTATARTFRCCRGMPRGFGCWRSNVLTIFTLRRDVKDSKRNAWTFDFRANRYFAAARKRDRRHRVLESVPHIANPYLRDQIVIWLENPEAHVSSRVPSNVVLEVRNLLLYIGTTALALGAILGAAASGDKNGRIWLADFGAWAFNLAMGLAVVAFLLAVVSEIPAIIEDSRNRRCKSLAVEIKLEIERRARLKPINRRLLSRLLTRTHHRRAQKSSTD